MPERRLRISGYVPTTTEAVAVVEDIPKARRVRTAITGFGTWFLIALVSVLVPVGHFILVPVSLIVAFTLLFRRLGQTSRVVSCRGACPDCGAQQDLDIPGSFRLPVDVTCRSCQRRLTLTE